MNRLFAKERKIQEREHRNEHNSNHNSQPSTLNPQRIIFLSIIILCLTACTIHTNEIHTVRGKGGVVYHGQLVKGKREGLGVLSLGDSILYSGRWHNGMRQGRGTVRDSEGRLVIGQWDHDTLVTAMRRDSAGIYHGEMDRQFRAHGYGHYIDTLNTYYEGQWKDGHRTGFGFSSQHRYFRVGEWLRDTYRGERLNYTSERVYGIDLSKHQHVQGRKRYSVDWDRLRITHLGSLSKKNVSGHVDYEVSFIFIKSTEGASLLNPYYASDYAAARSHGYPVGSYHYFTHRTSGAQQAWHFLSHSHFKKGDLPPVLDLEPLPSQVIKMGGARAMWSRVRNWLQIVEKETGMRPILYISQTFINRWLDDAPDIKQAYPVWIARYGEYKPDVKLWIWQLAPDGKVRGIAPHTDINVFNGYRNEFRRWLARVTKK